MKGSEWLPLTGIALERDTETGEMVCGYVGFGGHAKELRSNGVGWLGFAYTNGQRRGVLHDIALGYLSGFPWSAILWYLLTRSLPPQRIRKRILAWEARTGRYDGTPYDIRTTEPVDYFDVLNFAKGAQ